MAQSLEELMGLVATQFGEATGEAIKSEINALLGMPNVDIQQLKGAISQIQTLLDADPNTDGFQLGQNIVTSLSDLASRLATVESSTVIPTLQASVLSLTNDIAAEKLAREAADVLLQSQVDAMKTNITTMQATIDALPAYVACDCAAISTELSRLGSEVVGLKATDASTAVQVSDLQTKLATLMGQLATASQDAGSAMAAATNAAGAAAAAQQTANNNAAALAVLDAREQGSTSAANSRLTTIETTLGGISNIDAASLTKLFKAGIVAGKAGTTV